MTHHHGTGPIDPLAPRSPLYQGPFGRLFSDLPPWTPERAPGADPRLPLADVEADGLLGALASTIEEVPGADAEALARGDVTQADLDSGIPAGYTYFGQFVDHDITFDPASSLQRANDPNGLLNFRTPRLDLDNVYGRGPADQPYLYDAHQPGKLLIGTLDVEDEPLCVQTDDGEVVFEDLPRNSQGRALIGDMRNDENAMVSQMQLAFLKAHNALVDRAHDRLGLDGDEAFERARMSLRWLYQWVVWHDDLARVCDEKVHAKALKVVWEHDRATIDWGYGDVYSWKERPFMPVEFSVAAYRFGHTMVRNSYQPSAFRGDEKVPIFSHGTGNLSGFRPMEPDRLIQWDRYLQMTTSGPGFPQEARKIDPFLANALSELDEEADRSSLLNRLAFRNLKRGWRMGLPSGTAVARALGVEPIEIPPARDALWLYMLTEAQQQKRGTRLGTVGSILVAATIAGLLKGDPSSWVNQDPRWKPADDPLLDDGVDNIDGDATDDGSDAWTLAAIIRIAGVPFNDEPFAAIPAPMP